MSKTRKPGPWLNTASEAVQLEAVKKDAYYIHPKIRAFYIERGEFDFDCQRCGKTTRVETVEDEDGAQNEMCADCPVCQGGAA